MNLNEWAIKWGVPFEAVEDLRRSMGTVNTDPIPQVGESETAVQTRVRLEASRIGGRLWRNNVGAGKLQEGSFLRWGLANESKEMNKIIKSSDLIGLKPVLITSEHIGQVIGQFVAREVKPEAWRYGATEREQAQLKFLELVASLGGDAAFANGEGTL
jgi:hypothetical protein